MPEPHPAAQPLIDLGRARLNLGELAAAEAAYAQALDAAHAAGDPPLAAEALRGLAAVCFQRGDYADAARRCRDAIEFCRANDCPRQGAAVLRILGMCCENAGELPEAIGLLADSLAMARSAGAVDHEAASLLTLGRILQELGDLPQAAEQQERALQAARLAGDEQAESYALNNLGEVAAALGRHHEARRLLAESLEIKARRRDARGKVYSLVALGEIELREGHPAKALPLFEEALEIAGGSTLRGELPGCLRGLAQAHAALGRVEEARASLDQAVAVAASVGHRIGQAKAMLLLVTLGLSDRPQDSLRDVHALAKHANALPLVAEVHRLLALSEEKAGNLAAALEHSRRLTLVREEQLYRERRWGMTAIVAINAVDRMAREAELERLRSVDLAEALKEAERLRAMADSTQARLVAAINTAPDGFAAFGPDGLLEMANERIAEFLPGLGDLPSGAMDFAAAAALIRRLGGAMPDRPADRDIELPLADGRHLRLTVRVAADGRSVLRAADVSIYKEANRSLAAALAKEKGLSRAYRSFVSMVSHQFRTPLAVIDSNAQRMMRRATALPPAEIVERAEKIRGSTQRLTALMESTLNAARLEVGDFTPVPKPFDLVVLLSEIVSTHHDVAPDREIFFESDVSALPVRADRALVEQAVSNLVANAVKYSPAGSPIWVGLASGGAGVSISVADQGIGIPPEELPKIFDRFFRASNVASKPGTGIGLNFACQVIRMHGGDIRVESRQGEGTTFTVLLPAGLLASPPGRPGADPG
ncbi:MAG TPA: tetratricopeptide repeat protein [Azospirillaceae bacterium]|nr:tetratricopeptide repeat protein [Azospirillaceae bacterium]